MIPDGDPVADPEPDWEPPVSQTGGTDGSRWLERIALVLVGLVAGGLVVYAFAPPQPRVTVRTAPVGGLAPVTGQPVPWREAQGAYSVTCREDAVTALHLRIDGLPRDLAYAAMLVPAGGDRGDAVQLGDVASVRLLHGAGTAATAVPVAVTSDARLGSIEIEARFERPPDAGLGLPGLYAHHQLEGGPAGMTPVLWIPPRWWVCDRT